MSVKAPLTNIEKTIPLNARDKEIEMLGYVFKFAFEQEKDEIKIDLADPDDPEWAATFAALLNRKEKTFLAEINHQQTPEASFTAEFSHP